MLQNLRALLFLKLNADRVEKVFVRKFKAEGAQITCELTGQAMNALGNGAQAFWAMVDRIH